MRAAMMFKLQGVVEAVVRTLERMEYPDEAKLAMQLEDRIAERAERAAIQEEEQYEIDSTLPSLRETYGQGAA